VGVVGEHAVVIGGAIGGLAAARSLSSRFARVTVIDRDELPDDARDRQGVAHGKHAHLLLIAGRLELEKLFPGLTKELIAGGAVPFDPARDQLFVQGGGERIRYDSGMLAISLSRAFLESTLRRRVAALPNVEIRDRTAACGLAGASGRVTGVEIEDGEPLTADLVIDATGHGGGRADRWLEKLGCPAPKIDTVKVNVGYTTRLLRRRDGDLPDGALVALVAPTAPHQKRAAAAIPIEGDRWIVTIGEWHREELAVDPAGFAEFAASLPVPYVADLIAGAEPIGDVAARQFPASRRRYFERLSRVPHGYLALGDAICSFNPLYGQGMTVAALEALELGECLDRFGAVSVDMAREYYRATGALVDTPWMMATGGDFAYPETTGRKPRGIDLLNRYMRRVVQASHVSPEIHRVVLEVQHMLTPPSALLRPGTVIRSLRAARRSPARARPATPTGAPDEPPAETPGESPAGAPDETAAGAPSEPPAGAPDEPPAGAPDEGAGGTRDGTPLPG
jgi:2-polyprenyl-6-methoxyphenol hydroxylase-like FAD-dependent oxidoreductase